MSERKRRKLGDIQQEISLCKANLSLSEGKIIGSIARPDPRFSTPSTTAKDMPPANDEIVLFIKNLTKLKDTLEEKNSILEAQGERSLAVLENDVARLQNENKRLNEAFQESEKKAKICTEESRRLAERVRELQEQLRGRFDEGKDDLSTMRKENTELKLQNRTLKADNKVIMNHLDRLTKDLKEKESGVRSKNTLEQRQLRVMRSLYQESLPNIEHKESQRCIQKLEEPRHRLAAEEATERNGELKAVVRRLLEEVQQLKREKELLMEENRQKHLNMESQKQLVKLAEEEKARQDSLVRKMGDKIMALEEANQTLRDAAAQLDPPQEESYYRTTRAKAGQFYYRK